MIDINQNNPILISNNEDYLNLLNISQFILTIVVKPKKNINVNGDENSLNENNDFNNDFNNFNDNNNKTFDKIVEKLNNEKNINEIFNENEKNKDENNFNYNIIDSNNKSIQADALSTALLCMGKNDALNYANEHDLKIIIATKDREVIVSDKLKDEFVFNEITEKMGYAYNNK